jgi:dihydropteroate synthase
MQSASSLAGVPIGGNQPVRLMAAINVSPESFYGGSVRIDDGALRAAAQQAVDEGADFIDIGAKSTAPYLDTTIPLDEEMRRMARAVEVVAAVVAVPISADTTRAAVAVGALTAGARIVNDVSGLRGDAAMADVAAQADGVVLAASPDGDTGGAPIELVRRLLIDSLRRAQAAGIARGDIVLDPGIGFFARSGSAATGFNCAVLHRLAAIADLGLPLLVGASRKAFVGRLTGRTDPAARLAGSLAAAAVAVYNGAAIIRTHDVAPTRDAVRVASAIRAAD